MQHIHDFTVLGFWAPGPLEWAVIGVVAVLLFGRRLPELGRSLGRGLVEFKRGLHEVQNEIANAGEEPGPDSTTPPPEAKPDNTPNPGDRPE